jgi:hypothetical protein
VSLQPSFSIAIMAHPSRSHLVRELSRRLPGAAVVWDEKGDRWDTGRRSMLAHDPEAQWHLVVQDDAVLCRDFLAQVYHALQAAPQGPVAFYMGTTGRFAGLSSTEAALRAHQLGLSWVEAPGPWWGVAVAVPVQHIPAMVSWCDERSDLPNYDRRMARYWHHLGIPCRYSVPSLVQHRTGEGNPSLVPGRGNRPGRVAALWHRDGRMGPWGTGALELYRATKAQRLASICVMAHPSRAHYVEPLREQLGGAELVMDHGGGVWRTAVQAWEARDNSADWHVVVQDDAVPCSGFQQALQEVLRPGLRCVSLYLGRNVGHLVRRATWQVQQGRESVELERLYWGVGIALPTYLVPMMLRWTHENASEFPDGWRGKRCDSRVSRFCLAHSIPVHYPLPSLVDHRVGESLVGGYQQEPEERVAWWWRDGSRPPAVARSRR